MKTPGLARQVLALCVCALLVQVAAPLRNQAQAGGLVSFRRGDANLDGFITLADASYLMNAFYFAGPMPRCQDAADVDDDGVLGEKDPLYLLNWLFFKTETPPAPPPPFAAAGKDPTAADALDCGDDTIAPPGSPDPGLALTLAVPPDLAQGQKGVDIFLHATWSGSLDGFSAAYLVDKASIEVVRVDLTGTDFPQDRRLAFEASEFFRTAVVPGPDSHHDAILAGALFVELVGGKPEKIVFPGLLQAGRGFSLLRLLVNVKDDAPLGDRDLLIPSATPSGLAGAVTEVVQGGFTRLPGSSPPGRTYIVRDPGKIFMRRADANGDQVIDISDPVRTLRYLYSGAPPPPCQDAADVNDDGLLNGADPVFTLNFLFNEGPSPSLPFPGCGLDLTLDTLSCLADCS